MGKQITAKRYVVQAAVLLATSVLAWPTYAAALHVPRLSDVQRNIRNTSIELNDPEMGYGEKFREFTELEIRAREMGIPFKRTGLVANVALYNLLAGNVAQFNERLNEYLVNVDSDSDSTTWAENVAGALHLATEAGVTIADVDVFRRAIAAIEAKGPIKDPQMRLYSASYFYLARKTAPLQALAVVPPGTVDRTLDGVDALFVAGYSSLLLAKLTNSSAAAQSSIDYLRRCMEVAATMTAEYPGYFGEGRMALQMADAYRLLAQWTKQPDQRRAFVDEAVKAARLARQNIELLDYPLLWGAAHRVTSEVLDILYKEQYDPDERERLALLRDRAYELSLSYQ